VGGTDLIGQVKYCRREKFKLARFRARTRGEMRNELEVSATSTWRRTDPVTLIRGSPGGPSSPRRFPPLGAGPLVTVSLPWEV